jgi:4-phytase/acid phosphatase
MRTLAALLLSLTLAGQAQTSQPASPPDQLRFTLILSRHGIRPPLVQNTTLDTYSTSPWPAWEVPLGYLTPHGVDALVKMGQYLRLDLADSGLIPPTGCPAPADIFLYADTDERNIASTRATLQGFAPGCAPLDVHTVVPGKVRDALFSPVPDTFPAPSGPPAVNALRAALHFHPEVELTARGNPELNTLAQILAPDPAHPAANSILAQPVDFKPGDWGVSARGPLPTASTLIEDLELEYVDAKPMSDVGWGRADAATIHRLLPLHVKAFGLGLRTPLYARAEGSNLLAHILATLQQAAPQGASKDSKSTQPIGPAGVKLVYVSAHDSNLFALGGLLGLHWTADGRSDDTPPDSQLVFELWQRPGSSHATLRILYRAQTLFQLRSADDLTLNHPPDEVELTPTGCVAHQPCPVATFLRAAHQRINPAFVQPELAPTQIAP